jgi:hypothetical protein
MLMMLAFFIDQIQEVACELFQRTKKRLELTAVFGRE